MVVVVGKTVVGGSEVSGPVMTVVCGNTGNDVEGTICTSVVVVLGAAGATLAISRRRASPLVGEPGPNRNATSMAPASNIAVRQRDTDTFIFPPGVADWSLDQVVRSKA